MRQQAVTAEHARDRRLSGPTDPAVGCLIHVTLHFAGVLHQVVDSPVTQRCDVGCREYCLYTRHITTRGVRAQMVIRFEVNCYEFLPTSHQFMQ